MSVRPLCPSLALTDKETVSPAVFTWLASEPTVIALATVQLMLSCSVDLPSVTVTSGVKVDSPLAAPQAMVPLMRPVLGLIVSVRRTAGRDGKTEETFGMHQELAQA